MKRIGSVGLLGLLLCHTLAYLLVLCSVNWQEEQDLSSRLRVYRTVDSIVEFYVPLKQQTSQTAFSQRQTDGFAYMGSFYEIVRLEVHNDTLLILGFSNKTKSLWQQDLLSFIDHQFTGESSKSQKKANHLLKNLLKEYCPLCGSVVNLIPPHWRENQRIPSLVSFLSDRDIPVHSPPPRA